MHCMSCGCCCVRVPVREPTQFGIAKQQILVRSCRGFGSSGGSWTGLWKPSHVQSGRAARHPKLKYSGWRWHIVTSIDMAVCCACGDLGNIGSSAEQAMHVGIFGAVLSSCTGINPPGTVWPNAAGDIVWLLCTGSRAVQLLQDAGECLTCYDDLVVSAVWSARCPLPAHVPCGVKRAYIIIAVAMQHVCCSCCGLVVSWGAICTLLPLLSAQVHVKLVSRGCVHSLKSGVACA